MNSPISKIKKVLPKSIEKKLRSIKLKYLEKKSPEKIFSTIYEKSLWGKSDEQFFSGTGSLPINSKVYIEWINQFLKIKNIKSIVDLGCGDFRVSKQLDLKDINYTGCDVVPQLIEHNNETFGNDKISFQQCNIIENPLPEGELCLIRQVFQHLSNKSILSTLQKMKKYKYILITDFQPHADTKKINNDIPNFSGTRYVVHETGLWLENEPFNQNIEIAFQYDYIGQDEGYLRGVLIKN